MNTILGFAIFFILAGGSLIAAMIQAFADIRSEEEKLSNNKNNSNVYF